MTQRDRDRQAALGWIAGQLAWETRLQTLRTDPVPGSDTTDLIPEQTAGEDDAAPVEEIDTAA